MCKICLSDLDTTTNGTYISESVAVYWVECKCGNNTDYYDTIKEAIDSWNKGEGWDTSDTTQ